MGEIRLALEELYGLTTDGPSDDDELFVRLTSHLGYLFGWKPEQTADVLNVLVPGKAPNTYSSDTVSEIWSALAALPLRFRDSQSPTPQAVACDLILHWRVLAEQRKIATNELPTIMERSIVRAWWGIGYPVDGEAPARSNTLPKELFAMLKGPQVTFMDVLAEIGKEPGGGTSWRQAIPATTNTRVVMHAHGILPTLEMYLTDHELEVFRDIAWRDDDLFLSAFENRDGLEFGFVWPVGEDIAVYTAPVSGAHGRYSLALAMALGLVRIEVFDASHPTLEYKFSRTVYVSTDQCTAFFNSPDIRDSVSNDLLAPAGTEFLSIDSSRHVGVIASSNLLRQASVAQLADEKVVQDYDSRIDIWRQERRLKSKSSPRPSVPPELETVLGPTGKPSDYLESGEIFLHLEFDRHRSELGFLWVDSNDNYSEHYECVTGSFNPALDLHLQDRKRGELPGKLGVISQQGESALRALFELLQEPFIGWKSILTEKPTRIWYSTGRQLTGVPLHLLFSVIAGTECVRSPSLFISALVDDILKDGDSGTQRLVDVFDCSAGESRIMSASKECKAVRDCYGLWLEKSSSEDFLESKADVIHVSAHGKGFGDAADNMLLLGPSGTDVVDVVDILRTPGSLRAELVFLDVCSVGSVDNAATAMHEGVSVADAILLRGARFVVAAEWPLGDFYGALYSVAFHAVFTQNHNVPTSLHIVRCYFQGTLDYADMSWILDGVLDRTFLGWRERSLELGTRLDDLGYLAAFEVHGRPVRKRVAVTPTKQELVSSIALPDRAKPYWDARKLRDSW